MIQVSWMIALCFTVLIHQCCAREQKYFIDWITSHGKMYEDVNELSFRFHVFQRNLAWIEQMNARNNTFSVAMNEVLFRVFRLLSL
jgi:hypothetical protein